MRVEIQRLRAENGRLSDENALLADQLAEVTAEIENDDDDGEVNAAGGVSAAKLAPKLGDDKPAETSDGVTASQLAKMTNTPKTTIGTRKKTYIEKNGSLAGMPPQMMKDGTWWQCREDDRWYRAAAPAE